MSDDPADIRSIAVTPSDVVDAAVYGRENPGEAVLRITPPFHGRMRARLHVSHSGLSEAPDAIHVDPDALLEPAVVDAYPSVESQLEEAVDEEAEQLRERRGEALEEWRERALESIRESIRLETDRRSYRVDVATLG